MKGNEESLFKGMDKYRKESIGEGELFELHLYYSLRQIKKIQRVQLWYVQG